MSLGAARGDDAEAFFAADIGETREFSASTAITQNSDVDGPFVPGRYLIHALGILNSTVIIWVGVGPFVVGSPLSFAAVAGKRRFPFATNGIIGIETNVVKGDSDRIAVITTTGTATIFVSRIQRGGRR